MNTAATSETARRTAPDPRRLAPPDRRSPVPVDLGGCPAGSACGCCPGRKNKGHERGKYERCPLPHPGQDTLCRQPYPAEIAPCPEREDLRQHQPHRANGAACVECGRVTSRRWTDPDGAVLPWCSGVFPD